MRRVSWRRDGPRLCESSQTTLRTGTWPTSENLSPLSSQVLAVLHIFELCVLPTKV